MTFLVFLIVISAIAVAFLETHPDVAQALEAALFGEAGEDDARS